MGQLGDTVFVCLSVFLYVLLSTDSLLSTHLITLSASAASSSLVAGGGTAGVFAGLQVRTEVG